MRTLTDAVFSISIQCEALCEASFVPGPAFIKKHKHHHNTDQTAEDKYISKSNLNFDRFSHMIKRLAHSSRQSDNLDLPYVMDG